MRYLVVDGMLSGTGVRDAVEGGYVELDALGISPELAADILLWVGRYGDAHLAQFRDQQEVGGLDAQGLALCRRLKDELPQSKVEYFSTGAMRELRVD